MTTNKQKRLTAKQEAFALLLFQNVPQREAWGKAGYSTNMALSTIDENASRLAHNSNVLARLAELRNAVASPAIATVEERQKRLTEFIRADLVDFITPEGIKVDKQSPNVGAVSELTTKTKVFRKGGEPVNITTIKLRDPIAAIAELNKMEHIYEASGNIRDVNVVFVIGKGYRDLPQLTEGEDGKIS